MRLILTTVVSVIIASVLTSCSREKEHEADRNQANALYAELTDTYKNYTDSLSNIKIQTPGDSLAENPGEAIINRFEQRLINVYRKYPADMDMNLTEAQNDTIWQLAQLYFKQRNRFLHHSIPSDSILQSTDSTEVAQ